MSRKLSILAILALLGVPVVGAQETRPGDLALEPGDAVRLEFLDRPRLDGEYRVAYDGAALLPRIGFVDVEGRPFSDVRSEIGGRFEEALGDGIVYRITPLVRVSVFGEVRQPGVFTVEPTDRMAELLARAGGLTSAADRSRIVLLREGREVARLDPDSPRLETSLFSHDRIVVGSKSWLRQNLATFVGALGSVAAAAVAGLIIR